MSKSPIPPTPDQNDATVGFQPLGPSPGQAKSDPNIDLGAHPNAYQETIDPSPDFSEAETLAPSQAPRVNAQVAMPLIEGYKFFEELGRGATSTSPQARQQHGQLVERSPKAGQRAGLVDWYAGQVKEELKKTNEAVALDEASITRLSQMAKATPDNADLLEDLGLAHGSRAYCIESTDPDKAYQHFQLALEIHRKTAHLRPHVK